MLLKLITLNNVISLNIVKELTKFRLTLSVVFSSFISYFLGVEIIDFTQLSLLLTGGILIVGSSNIFNQIIEKDLDKLMARTKNRPLPKKKNITEFSIINCINMFSVRHFFYVLD